MTALLVINMPHPVKASTCSASASAGGVQNQRFLGSASLMQPRQQTRDQGCSSASVAVGGPSGGTACGAANNGGGGLARLGAATVLSITITNSLTN
jgi:hypothetical protein